MISDEIKGRILFLHGRGKSARAIAQELGCAPNTVRLWLRRQSETGAMRALPRSGRPRCTTAAQDQAAVEAARLSERLSAPQVRTRAAFPASCVTLRRRLHEAGLVVRTARQRELALSLRRTQEARVEWAERMWEEWAGWSDRTVYVDEAVFESCSRHRVRAWVPKILRGRIPHWIRRCGRLSISVFGGLCGDQLLPLYVCAGTFTAAQYRDVLSELYWPVMQEMFGDSSFRLQQDNAAPHRGLELKEWLRAHPQLEAAMTFQPPYSPDLNPIEHVWARMKKKLKGGNYTTAAGLTEAVVKAWDELSQEHTFLAGLTNSMPRRLNAVIAAEGGPTKY